MDRAALVAADTPRALPHDVAYEIQQPAFAEAQALAQALQLAQEWTPQILTTALASLGDIDLPPPAVPPRGSDVLAALPTLYWVYGLDQAGVLKAAETVAGLWASGAPSSRRPHRSSRSSAACCRPTSSRTSCWPALSARATSATHRRRIAASKSRGSNTSPNNCARSPAVSRSRRPRQ